MEYKELLQISRLRTSSRTSASSLKTEVGSDFGRIITSAAFRRLQAKAQVFSLEENDSVRTRLTHSQEVASVGRQIASKILDKTSSLMPPEYEIPFISTIENACLLHDIGNPPFGHFGEYAIASWFKDNKKAFSTPWSSDCFDEHYSDFTEFDGNPQGFRIMTKLSWHSDEYGLNLTCSLLSAYLKYLSDNKDPKKGSFFKKKGYFKVDADRAALVRASLNIASPNFRNPLTFLMEAADDTSYCVSDIEDGIEKGIIKWRDISEFVEMNLNMSEARDLWTQWCQAAGRKKLNEKVRFVDIKIMIIGRCTDYIADRYIKLHSDLMTGKVLLPLYDSEAPEALILDCLKKFAKEKLFTSKQACDLELCSYKVIRGLLDHFMPLLVLKTAEFEEVIDENCKSGLRLERHLVQLLPLKHRTVYQYDKNQLGQNLEPIARAHLIVDYISGMTDNHALHVYQLLSGITTRIRA